MLSELRKKGIERCEAPKPRGFNHKLSNWTPLEWGGAAAGEMGELCNLLKKLRRGDQPSMADIASEIGDVVIYLDLLAARLNIDLEWAIVHTFNMKSEEIGSDIRIVTDDEAPCRYGLHE